MSDFVPKIGGHGFGMKWRGLGEKTTGVHYAGEPLSDEVH